MMVDLEKYLTSETLVSVMGDKGSDGVFVTLA